MGYGKIFRRTGSILMDYLLTLFITSLMIPVVLSSLLLLTNYLKENPYLQDEIASYQLRRILSLSYDPYIEENSLYFTYRQSKMNLSFVNGNLIIQPGTQIMYLNIDSCDFFEENGVIWVLYERNGKEIEQAITKK